MLSEEVERLWREYREVEKDRIRHLMIERLDRFIDALLTEDRRTWHAWAENLAASIDRGADVVVRFPLFRRVLLPVLAEGVNRGKPHYARWLAQFNSLLFQCDLSALPEHLRTQVGLLEEALRQDPEDTIAKRRLVKANADCLEYTIHELPAGVLYGSDGTTLQACTELLELLSTFHSHVTALGETDKYSDLIAECNFHYDAYRDYLQDRKPGEQYAEYLERRNNR